MDDDKLLMAAWNMMDNDLADKVEEADIDGVLEDYKKLRQFIVNK